MNKHIQHVVITGAGSGLGASLAKKYNEKELHVTLIGRTKEKLERVAETFTNSAYSIYPLDVSKSREVGQVFKDIQSTVQPIDILVNNAGVGYFDLAEDLEAEDINQMIDINLKGTIYCTQQVIGEMKERDSGAIINVVSTAGVQGKVNESAYCASKFGVRGFTESIVKELEDTQVHAHGIYMSGMKTPFWEGTFEKSEMDGMMDPEDIADIILANTKDRPNLSVPEVVIENH